MALTVGDRLGHYDVTALIGEGGMGQVYRATDTQLHRDVALKILPDAFAADPDRLARFQREAQVLASLNHPGIAAIYGIEKSDDTQALVLELVEGPTLAECIAAGSLSPGQGERAGVRGLPLEDALPIARQIAEALEAAHEAGVIHRDLKPANIKVRDDGTVKVLDFGLAKALETAPEGDPSQSPTLTAAATQMGVIMGTAAYMAPEQAKGRVADKRADVWAFGGRWVGFLGDGDVKKVSLDGGIPVTVAEDAAGVEGVAWLADGTLVLGQRSGPLLTMPDAGGAAQPLTTLADGEGRHQFPSVLPDGRNIVFVAVSGGDETAQVVVYSRDTGERRTLLRGASPQVVGGHLVFARDFTLWAVPFDLETLVIDGDPVPVLEDVTGLIGATTLYATAPNGTLIYRTRGSLRSRLAWVERDGTTTSVGSGDAAIFHPPIDLSPDDRFLAVTRHQDSGTDEVMLYDLGRGTSRPLLSGQDSRWPVWAPDSERLAFASTQAGSWDVYRVTLGGAEEPESLLVRERVQVPSAWSPDGRTLLFQDRLASDRSLQALTDDDEPELIDTARLLGFSAAFAPSGDWLAYTSRATGRGEVYVQSWPDGDRREIVSTNGGSNVRWSGDGTRLFYLGPDGLYSVSFETGPDLRIGLPELVVAKDFSGDQADYDVTSDGARVVALLPEPDESGSSIHVVLNWADELRQIVPTN